MTLPQLTTLSTSPEGREELRVMLSELRGWERFQCGTIVPRSDYGASVICRQCNVGFISHNPCIECPPEHKWELHWEQWKLGNRWVSRYSLPDYCNDLNACREVEKTLNAEQQIRYGNIIGELNNSRHWSHHAFNTIHASALHRTIAAILTLSPQEA